MKIFLPLLLLLSALRLDAAETAPSPWYGVDEQGQVQLELYFFWSVHCPHCKEALPLVRRLDELPWLRVHQLEVSRSLDNQTRFAELAALFGEQARSVPAFFYCGRMQLGFDSEAGVGQLIEQELMSCHAALSGDEATEPMGVVTGSAPTIPLLGQLDRSHHSLLLITVVIAALDAFNPCAFFVLLFLLSMLVHMRSRRRMLFIGGVFVFVSGALYFVFIAAWLNLFLLLGMQRIFTLIAGVVALILALVNIKDYLRPGQGLSLSIPASKKPGLFARMRGLLQAENLAAMTLATITLAIAANTYELLCTAGLPMVYTRILTLEALPTAEYYLYLLLYSLIYILPLLLIVVLFTWGMGQRKIQAHEGQLLKLLAGMMMLMMGLGLLLAPQLMSSLPLIISAMGFAVVVTLAAWWKEKNKRKE